MLRSSFAKYASSGWPASNRCVMSIDARIAGSCISVRTSGLIDRKYELPSVSSIFAFFSASVLRAID